MNTVIITPVRNEAQYIGTTLRCMIAQTVKPIRWVIVDDGSTDGTGEIIEGALDDNPFIRYVFVADRGFRKPAVGVVETFYRGLREVEGLEYDILAKFDGDLEFPPDMIASIIGAFEADPRLGVTGGRQFERLGVDQPLKEVRYPEGFVAGAYKFYRRECFEAIGGIIRRAGWDGVDTVRAAMQGWQTGQLPSLELIHLKTSGTARGEGIRKSGLKYGDVSYYMGGYFWHFLLHVLRLTVLFRKPAMGYWTAVGYFRALFRREEREPVAFRRFLKKQQLQHFKNLLRAGLRRRPVSPR